MIPIEKAIRIVARQTAELGSQLVRIEDAAGRILAEDIVADTDLPPFDRSQMDGYAVIATDTSKAPVRLPVVGESAAGRGWHRTLEHGQSIRIMTGAPVPGGANAVVRMEVTREQDGFLEIPRPVKKNTSIVRRGSEIKKGKRILAAGESVTPNNIASIAAFGYSRVLVSKRPRVGILATGSEIVAVSKKPGPDQIRNSNSVMLKAQAEAAGADCEMFPPVGDKLSDLRSQISNAAKGKDILIITGGVSVGKYDLTKRALDELGSEIFFEKLKVKPGKPAVFARLGKILVFGLPGNPVSCAVTFYLLVRVAIMKMQGAQRAQLRTGQAVLATDVQGDKERDTFLPATLSADGRGQLKVMSLRSKGSSDLVGFASAEALISIPRGKALFAGDVATVFYL